MSKIKDLIDADQWNPATQLRATLIVDGTEVGKADVRIDRDATGTFLPDKPLPAEKYGTALLAVESCVALQLPPETVHISNVLRCVDRLSGHWHFDVLWHQ